MTRISVEELLNESASDTEEQRMKATMTLVFVTVSDNCKYSRQWSINSASATKLTLREFMRFMVSHSHNQNNNKVTFIIFVIFRKANAQGLPMLYLRTLECSTLMKKMTISLSGVTTSTRRWLRSQSTRIRFGIDIRHSFPDILKNFCRRVSLWLSTV